MGFLIRLIVIALIIYIAYRLARYMLDPTRKIQSAVAARTFYFDDDIANAQKNFHIAYQGVLFAGEKYMGTGEGAGKVVSIFVWMEDPAKLQKLTKEDFQFLENEIHKITRTPKSIGKTRLSKSLCRKGDGSPSPQCLVTPY